MMHEDRVRAASFGEVARQYDRARPGYPEALAESLLRDRPATVLDVGCGTGIAARLLRDRGATILGVEPDARMAEVARAHGLSVEEATFEDWPDAGRRFDLVISAQAWHWVHPDHGVAKATRLLTERGRIGVFWNLGRLPDAHRAAFEELYDRLAPGLDRYSVSLGYGDGGRPWVDAARLALARSDELSQIEELRFAHRVRYDRASWVEHLLTHNDHRALAEPRRSQLLDAVGAQVDRLGGAFDMSYETVLVTATRRVRTPEPGDARH